MLKSRKSRVAAILTLVVIFAGAAAWGYAAKHRQHITEAKDFDSLVRSEQFRNMTPRQQREVGGQFFMRQLEQKAQEYSELPAHQKEKYIKDLVEQIEQMRKEHQQQRDSLTREDGKNSTFQGPRPSSHGPGSGPRDPSRMRSRSENFPPETRAKIKQLMDDIRKYRN
jgi:hypothetical protein